MRWPDTLKAPPSWHYKPVGPFRYLECLRHPSGPAATVVVCPSLAYACSRLADRLPLSPGSWACIQDANDVGVVQADFCLLAAAERRELWGGCLAGFDELARHHPDPLMIFERELYAREPYEPLEAAP